MTEVSNWVTDIAQYLKDTAFMGGKVFAYQMKAGIKEGAMIIPPLEGLRYDPYMPKRYRGEFQCLIRTPNIAYAHAYANTAIGHLTLHKVQVGGVYIQQSIPQGSPIVYPASDGDYYEASVRFSLTMIDERLFAPGPSMNPGAETPEVAIWHSSGINSVLVNGDANVYPALSLEASNAGDLVTVKVVATGANVVGPKHFSKYTTQAGDTFATVAEVVQYLTGEFAKNTVGTGLSYEHTQSVASDTWTVTHNFGAYPSNVAVYVGGVQVVASVTNVDVNTVQISFLAPQTGTVSVSL